MGSATVVILGAGKPFSGTEPSALTQTSGDKRALDWLLEAFSQTLPDPEFHFIGGYRMDDIVDMYPDIHFSQNEDWETTGTVASLFTAPLPEDCPVYVCYADTVFETTAVDALDGTTAVTVDRSWQTRYRDRSAESLARAEKVTIDGDSLATIGTDIPTEDADAEFTGLIRFTPEALDRARSLYESRTVTETADLPALLCAVDAAGIDVQTVDIGESWAELDTAEDLSRFILDTKANTLRRLQSMVTESTILDQHTFTVDEWETAPDTICEQIADMFAGSVIVRSSALTEDSWNESNAGRFESVLDVPTDDPQSITEAITHVIDSYPDRNPGNQVLIQPMIDDVDQSGVVMTRTLETASPYYVINYDATTASTESVTDGTGEHLRTAFVRKDVALDVITDESTSSEGFDGSTDRTTNPQYPSNPLLEPLLDAVHELEEIIGHDSLDIEFAIDGAGEVYVLQTRPMTIDPAEHTVDDTVLFDTLDQSRQEFVDSQQSPPFVFGDRTIYGVMPDWNPAEIIGRQPRQLAASLYRYLIMNETWAKQRAEYGYRDVRPHPLMKSFAGQPYVDVRADFNSFIPATVPGELAERLVDYYLDRFEANPEFHDKVEFDIVLTCLTADYEHQIEPLLDAGFTKEGLEPFREGLREITKEGIRRIKEDIDTAEIDRLERRYDAIVDADLPPLKTAYYLLDDCRRLGTLPFAHLARTAFVATSLLRSLERIGVLTTEQRSAFQNSLNTVARQFERDGYRVAGGDLDWDTFVDRYGHLRPGTYEITSPAYRQNPQQYLRPIVETGSKPDLHPDPVAVWDDETKRDIESELKRLGLPVDADRFIEFLAEAIEGREHSKFVFSRNLSAALEQIAEFGEQHGFIREELSHLPLETFFDLTLDHPPSNLEEWLAERVREGREQHTMTAAVELPPLLFGETDFGIFERPTREPNFVTNDTITADVVELDDEDVETADLDGKIILIEQADPGYDWLFGHDIAGLVTKYGGPNSHMAVRAAEFSLPAAIGVGENRYDQLRRAAVLELNCGALSTQVIQ